MKAGKYKGGPTVFRTHGHCFMYLGDYNGHSYWWDSGHKSQGSGADARFGDAHKGGWIYKTKQGNCINGGSRVIAYYNVTNVDPKYLGKTSTTVESKSSSKKSSAEDKKSKKDAEKAAAGSGLIQFNPRSQLKSAYGKADSTITKLNIGGAKGSNILSYKPSVSGRKVLLDNSGRFSGGASKKSSTTIIKNKPINVNTSTGKVSIGGSIIKTPTVNFNNTSRSVASSSKSSSSNEYGISKETAALLKVIITLVEQLVSNTDKVDNIYSILEEYCNKSGNADLTNSVSTVLGASGSGNNNKKNSYVPRGKNTNATIESLADLKNIVNSILVS